MGIIFSSILVVLPAILIILEVRILRKWKGLWRIGGVFPGAALTVVALNIVIGVNIDVTSHNLWPMEIVIWSLGGLVYLGILSLVRRIVAGPR